MKIRCRTEAEISQIDETQMSAENSTLHGMTSLYPLPHDPSDYEEEKIERL